jgi:DNA-binding NarL/FixJ family response regulator
MDERISHIRVLIGNVPGMVAHTLAFLIESQSDMKLIGQVEGQVAVLLAASKGADVVILGAPDSRRVPGLVSHLLLENPVLKVLVLSTRDNTAAGYWLDVRRTPIENVSAESLIRAVRELHEHTPGA